MEIRLFHELFFKSKDTILQRSFEILKFQSRIRIQRSDKFYNTEFQINIFFEF